MAGKKEQPKKPAKACPKPGPEAGRLKIKGDPLAAFDRLVKSPPPKKDGGQAGGE